MVYVIIPIFNAEEFLHECLDSVLTQQIDIRVICVDDGSFDSSLQILREYEKIDSRLTVISVENSGPSRARNTGLDYLFSTYVLGENDFISFLDSDDFTDLDCFGTLLTEQRSSDADIVCCNFRFYKNGESHPFALRPASGVRNSFDATLELVSDKTIQSHSPCKLYRASLWRDVRYPEDIVSMEDQGTIFKVFCRAKTVSFIDYDGYYYRQHESSVNSSPVTNKKVLDSLGGYTIAAIYRFEDHFSNKEANRLRNTAQSAFAACYLMMLPRFNKKTASRNEISALNGFKRLARQTRCVIRLKTGNNRLLFYKKWCYLLARPLYYWYYRRTIKTRNRSV